MFNLLALPGVKPSESRPGAPHCATCHVLTHNACLGCGRCLPEAGRYTSQAVTRTDRKHCSDACRQRAYRRRQSRKGA